MGFFGDVDLASVDADAALGLPDDTYEAEITKVESRVAKASGNTNLMITYGVTGGDCKGEEVTEFLRIPESDDDSRDALKARARIKNRLMDLNVPESRLNTVEPDDLVGTEVYVTTKRNGEYTNVRTVRFNDGADTPF